jgi:pimeloyl-ACP methyl ester carboxylesterase
MALSAGAIFAAPAPRGIPDPSNLDTTTDWVQDPIADHSKIGPGTAAKAADAPSQEERIRNLFRPVRVDTAELSPDGRHVAYAAYDEYRVRLIIVDVDHPESLAAVEVGQGNWWQKMTGSNWSPPHVTFLRWATDQRLIFAEGDNGIYAVNADGKGLIKLVTSTDVGVPKGQNLAALQKAAPPGMAQAPNQLDLMPGSPTTNLDPMLKAADYSPQGVGFVNPNAVGADPSVFGSLNGLSNVDPASSHDLDMADGRSNSYINNGGPDRAVDMAAALGTELSNTDIASDLVPRIPRVAAMRPDDPGHVVVEASGLRNPLTGQFSYGFYRVDITTGKRQSIGEAILPGHEVWYDQTGRPRVVLAAIGHTYLHAFPGRTVWSGARPLDRLMRDPAARGFQAKPEGAFAPRSMPIGFDYDPAILYYASNLGRDTMGLYAVDLKTGARTAFAVEDPGIDVVDPRPGEIPANSSGPGSPLVFDSHRRQLVGVRLAGPTLATRWFDPELAQMQARLGQEFPGRSVELMQWSEDRTRFLARVGGMTDPGRFYVYTPATDQLLLCARRAPWLSTETISASIPFAITGPDGTPLTGRVTAARNPRLHPAPLVVFCPDGPGQAPPAEFDAEAQAYAGMGFAVLRVNYRGSGGLGLAHLGAIRRAIDRAPIEDILAAIDGLQKTTPIDAKRIALVGEGFGGYLALRGVQLYPDRFRCAVSIGGPVDLRQWVQEMNLITRARTRGEDQRAFQAISAVQQSSPLVQLDALHADFPPQTPAEEDSPAAYAAQARLAFFGSDRAALAAISPLRSVRDVIRPIYLIQDGGSDPAFIASARALRSAVEKQGGEADTLTVDGPLQQMDPTARAKVLARIADFLNLDFYHYSVEIGPVRTKD